MMDLQNDIALEANEYLSYRQEQGLEGADLISALWDDAQLAGQHGRPELATAISHIVDGLRSGNLTRRFVTSRGDVVDSDLSDADAIEILRSMSWSDFARSLVQQYDKPRKGKKTPAHHLSDTQWAWVHKLATDQIAKDKARAAAKQREAEHGPTKFEKIRGLFEHALSTGHKTPRITLDMDEGRIRLSVAGSGSRTPGVIHITDGGPFGQNVYYGKLELDGTYKAGRNVPQWVLDTLAKLDGETLDFVVKYGQKTGNCCFCNAALATTESVTAGYGPICAERYGLPWG